LRGQTLLHRAVECRLLEDALRFLISKGLPLDQEDFKGETALDRALSSSFTEYFNILIQSGAYQASPTLAVKFYNQFIKDSSYSFLIRNHKILESVINRFGGV
jgi:ankyrin repeat protein